MRRHGRMLWVLLGMAIAVGVTGDTDSASAEQLRAQHRKRPVSVEVMNFPESIGGTVADEYFSVHLVQTPGRVGPMLVANVPADRALIITDFDGLYACGTCGNCQLVDHSGVRVEWHLGELYNRSYTTGLRFGPREQVYWTSPCLDYYSFLGGSITFMGKLVASPNGAFLDD